MTNPIDKVFASKKRLKIMAHLVAGCPDMETTEQLLTVMARCGVDLVEIQIPFSDPLADGPTIAAANQVALESGVTPGACFRLAKKMAARVDMPLLFMTYANIPFSMGLDTFVKKSAASGIAGLIVPDLPLDEHGGEYLEAARAHNCYAVPVVSPGSGDSRLKTILHGARGFVYTTLRVGITGARKEIDKGGLDFLDTLRAVTNLPVAAGFGISSAAMARQLVGRADAAVVGSKVLDLFNRQGIDAVAGFLAELNALSD